MIPPRTASCLTLGNPEANLLVPVRRNSVERMNPKWIPMHLAHRGIWIPSWKYDLSGSWWHTDDPRNISSDSNAPIENRHAVCGD
jgi:hypothetical protein